MPLAAAPIPLLHGLAEIAADYEAAIVDVWGVLHNGVAPFPGAPEALAAFRRTGRPVVLLSNVPRPSAAIDIQLGRLGVGRDAYDAIVTSGDLARRLVAARCPAPLFHVGPERDLLIFEGLDARLVGPDDARHIICTGLFDDTRETAENYRDRLAALAGRGVPMVCANPDLTVERGGAIIYCAGALGALYEELGGAVLYAGKPHPPVYDLAFEVLAGLAGRPVDRRRILAIGDGMRTDIAGAAAVGIPSLFVASPIHVTGTLTPDTLAHLFPPGAKARPVAALDTLRW
ncbi:MAG: TIGR01459 family HAD-type hydrolase [Hyphomicrobiaceae bacterium]